MPFIQRYSDVKKGGITFSGNTLGLSKATNLNAPCTQGSIGAFTSLACPATATSVAAAANATAIAIVAIAAASASAGKI